MYPWGEGGGGRGADKFELLSWGSLEFQDSWGVIMNVFLCLVDPNAITAFSSGPVVRGPISA